MGRWAALCVGIAAACLAAAQSGAGVRTLPRSLTDRPDEQRGPQVHVMYVLPSDGIDRSLDTDGTIGASVANFQAWLRGQTGGPALRLDTSAGELDVSFHRLGQTDAELAANGLNLRDAIDRGLRAAGFDSASKLYAVYYDGSNTAACGGGAWPPALPGTVAAVYMRATFGAGFLCYDPTRSRSGLQLMDLAVLHETLHTLGAVATCAPHHTRAGHVSDGPDDLMYAGDEPWVPSVLDKGRDDYYGTGSATCFDLARSPFLDSNAPPPPPSQPVRHRLSVQVRGPGRVVSAPTGISCPRRCTASFAAGTRVSLRAVPARGARFRSWGGACAGVKRCVVSMTRARTVTATFRR